MNDEQQKKLEKARKLQEARERLDELNTQPDESPAYKLEIAPNTALDKVHTKLMLTLDLLDTRLQEQEDHDKTVDDQLIHLNNELVKAIQIIEGTINLTKTGQETISKSIKELVRELPEPATEITVKNPTKIPDWLADKDSIKKLAESTSKIAKAVGDGLKELEQGQRPEDFVPFRRVKMSGKRLEFDDGEWGGSPGGGGLSSSVVVGNTTSQVIPVGHGKTLKTKTGSASATFTIVAAVSGKKIKVYALDLITASTTAVTVTFKDGAAGTALATYPLQAITGTNFGITKNVAVPTSLFQTSAGTLLEMSFSAAQTVTYNLAYWDDDES